MTSLIVLLSLVVTPSALDFTIAAVIANTFPATSAAATSMSIGDGDSRSSISQAASSVNDVAADIEIKAGHSSLLRIDDDDDDVDDGVVTNSPKGSAAASIGVMSGNGLPDVVDPSESGRSGGNAESSTLMSRVVHTKHGAVSGVIVRIDGRNMDSVEAFRGIPYASPPVKSLRFMPPVTGALWSGVRKADR